MRFHLQIDKLPSIVFDCVPVSMEVAATKVEAMAKVVVMTKFVAVLTEVAVAKAVTMAKYFAVTVVVQLA